MFSAVFFRSSCSELLRAGSAAAVTSFSAASAARLSSGAWVATDAAAGKGGGAGAPPAKRSAKLTFTDRCRLHVKGGPGGQVRGLPCACVATRSLVWSKTVAFLSELGTAALAHAALQLSSMALQRTFCSQYSKYLVYCGLEKVLVEGHQPLRAGALNETLRADCTADCTFA